LIYFLFIIFGIPWRNSGNQYLDVSVPGCVGSGRQWQLIYLCIFALTWVSGVHSTLLLQ